ncbi:SDR family oxidoreductase [Paenibacillus xylaniclasticus]|uniref:SDR family oxidoreductase n=1 Tax=Paenibacillus xylaniclasticus TaxID=588083 RepID=UPI000FD89CE0|nr:MULTISPECIES: SDR family oxidoreductase [Paenibacillus]GFN31548.1 NAD(P)-dependent oxidoreductase [Paenibacillus curdlanolyticus]
MSPSTPQKHQVLPPQHQNRQPGIESEMNPLPAFESPSYKPAGKLQGKVALITGGDSGIGKAAAVAFAKEGADVAIVYLDEHSDALATKTLIEQTGRRCLLLPGDIGNETFCKEAVAQTNKELGGIDILVNNSAEQHPLQQFEQLSSEQLERTFRTNVFGMFYVTQAAIPLLKPGASIINTASITAYKGNPLLIDYSATKGAIVSFTRSLALHLADRGIRVNGVAPGPVWTPLIPASFDAQQVSEFGSDTPMKRPGQPYEMAAAYVFLACDDSSFMTGQMIHLNGGEIVNG